MKAPQITSLRGQKSIASTWIDSQLFEVCSLSLPHWSSCCPYRGSKESLELDVSYAKSFKAFVWNNKSPQKYAMCDLPNDQAFQATLATGIGEKDRELRADLADGIGLLQERIL